MDEMHQKAQQAVEVLQRAVADELEKKRRLGQYAVVFKDGKTIRLEPDEIPVQEKQ